MTPFLSLRDETTRFLDQNPKKVENPGKEWKKTDQSGNTVRSDRFYTPSDRYT